MVSEQIIKWLLDGDIAIQYQVHRDLLSLQRDDLQLRIGTEGWGAQFLGYQKSNGHWGRSFYQPKWTSSHYTLLDLKNLYVSPDIGQIRKTVALILKYERGRDGGIHPSGSANNSDVCINGMFLNYASYFGAAEESLKPVIDFILSQRMPDGGFNCRLNRSGAKHSSLHTTLCVVEGIREFYRNAYSYRINDLLEAEHTSVEFIMKHQLFMSDRTGEIIHPGFLKLAYPGRWRYDILRALDYMRLADIPYNDRMKPAIHHILKKRRKDGTWSSSGHPGQTHFEMEKSGQPSRWNTLRAMRVLNYFGNSES